MATLLKYLFSVFAVLLVSGGLTLFRETVGPDLAPSAPLLLLVVVFLAATRTDLGPALATALVAGLCYDFFFLKPYYYFTIGRFEDIVAFAVFFAAAIVASGLATQSEGRARDAESRLQQTTALNTLSAMLLESGDGPADEVVRQVTTTVAARSASLYLAREDEGLQCKANFGDPPPQTVEQQDADAHQQLTALTVAGNVAYVPLRTAGRNLGLLIVRREADAPPFSATDGRLLSTIGTLLAGSQERQRLAREASEALVLREADVVKSSLLATVSHELRTPLASIMGSASSLLSDEPELDPENRRELLDTINQGAERLSRLVNNLLDLSRVEAGALHLERGLYSPVELINSVADTLAPRLANHKLATDLPADLPLVPMDYVLIEQVLGNLLDNAARYTPADTTITVAAHVEGEDLLISVEDEGAGLPQEDLSRIFDRFYRGAATNRKAAGVGGVGIGLTLARGFVEAHGGRIWAVNRQGGLRISFSLPLHPADMPEAAFTEEGE